MDDLFTEDTDPATEPEPVPAQRGYDTSGNVRPADDRADHITDGPPPGHEMLGKRKRRGRPTSGTKPPG